MRAVEVEHPSPRLGVQRGELGQRGRGFRGAQRRCEGHAREVRQERVGVAAFGACHHQDKPSAALQTAGAAARLAESTGNPLLIGRCHAALGITLAAAGDRPRAVAALEAAERVLASLGATGDADAAARKLRRLGERVARRVRHHTGGGLAALSPREREVAAAVAAGRTTARSPPRCS